MARPLKIAVAGLGRMGQVHALHVHELARDTGTCELAAVADLNRERASSVLTEMGADVPIFGSIEEMVSARVADATVIVTPTEYHRAHARLAIEAGQRVLLEKPLTGNVDADREFAAELDREHPNA